MDTPQEEVLAMEPVKKWTVELTREDVMNISKWVTATGMMVEAKLRTPLSESEHATWRKFQHIYHSSGRR